MTRSFFPLNYHLSDKDSEKKEKPEQNHHKQRDNRDEQTAEICPRLLIPGVSFGAMRAFALACQKGTLAPVADFDFHALRISKITAKFNGFRTSKTDFFFPARISRFFLAPGKNRLRKAYFLCANNIFRAQAVFSPRRPKILRAKHIFSAQRTFSLRGARFPRAKQTLPLSSNDSSNIFK